MRTNLRIDEASSLETENEALRAQLSELKALRARDVQALLNSEHVRSALAAGGIVGTWNWHPTKNSFTVDEGFVEAFGLDASYLDAEVPIDQVLLNVHPDDRPGLDAAIAEAVQRGGGYSHQYRVRRADGIYYWLDANGRVDFAPDGTAVSFPGFVVDVTERRAAEERLRVSEALARQNIERVQLALAAGAIIGTWNWDLAKDQFTIDEAFATAFGLDPALGREGIPLAQIVATVHPNDQAGLAAAIEEAIARGGAYAHQYRTRRADGNYYWLEANGRVDRAPDGMAVSFPGVLIDVEAKRAVESERDRVAAELRDSEAFLRSVLASSNDCIKVLDLDARLVFMSEGGQRVMEVSDFNAIAGCPWPDFWEEEGNTAARQAIAAARTGEASTFQGYAETMQGNRRFWDVQVSPILDENGRPERILSVSRDITPLKEAEEMRTVLAQELAHRMKNTLAMVQAIATQTLRQASTMEEGRAAISQRLGALSRAQDILTRTSNAEADVADVATAAIGPHQEAAERISMEGPRVVLTSQQALGLSLAIHELATNAAKYGALSNGTGRVEMAWGVPDGIFTFTWIETGGPPVAPPESRGFGSKLIERIVASYFDGEGRIDFDPSGIRFKLTGASDRPDLAA